MAADNKLAAMVERIMARNGVNVGPHRPNYTSQLSEYILQSELPLGGKSPSLLSFLGTLMSPLSNTWLGT